MSKYDRHDNGWHNDHKDKDKDKGWHKDNHNGKDNHDKGWHKWHN
jgi:hypothetical protein